MRIENVYQKRLGCISFVSQVGIKRGFDFVFQFKTMISLVENCIPFSTCLKVVLRDGHKRLVHLSSRSNHSPAQSNNKQTPHTNPESKGNPVLDVTPLHLQDLGLWKDAYEQLEKKSPKLVVVQVLALTRYIDGLPVSFREIVRF